jgi:hypothetical protein
MRGVVGFQASGGKRMSIVQRLDPAIMMPIDPLKLNCLLYNEPVSDLLPAACCKLFPRAFSVNLFSYEYLTTCQRCWL